jgi:hypothetical protein
MSCRIIDAYCCRICPCTLPLPMRAAIHASSVLRPIMDCPSPIPIVSPCCRFCRRCRSHQCCRIQHCPITSFQHCFLEPWTIHRPSLQLSSAHCYTSCCMLPHTHAVDFRYCHAGCHPVATVQQYFRQPTP